MEINFTQALADLGTDAVFEIANEARPPASYLFNTLLPETLRWNYTVDSGNMTVRSTMAGMSGMDSPYAPGGVVSASQFLEETAKLTIEVALSEKALRDLQTMLMQRMISGQPTKEIVQNEALNFLEKVILQAHFDRSEWLRAQALVYGAIDWTFNQKRLLVDYGVPAAHFLTTRTDAANTAYFDTGSLFWTDVREARRLLRYNLRAVIAHPDTVDDIVYNDVNSLEIVSQTGSGFTVQRLIGDNERPARDARDTVELIAYDLEGEILDPANPGQTIVVPFMPRGKVLFVANNTRSGYRVGEGSTDDPTNDLALGYHHMAPTIEGGGRPGRWGELYTPERAPYSLHGRGSSNELPVLEANDKLVVATTEMSG